MNVQAQLKIAIPNIPNEINHLEINSVGEYVIFDDLLRSLIKFDSNGEIAPDLVESWDVQDNYKVFIFKLKANQYFSDHSVISAQDVVKSLRFLMKNPDIIHGDVSKIKSIIATDDLNFKITLLNSDPFFLTELSAPEYRIIKKDSKNYEITSGSYSIESKSVSRIKLKINKHYPFTTDVKYKEVEYRSYDPSIRFSNDDLRNFDIIWPKSTMTLSEIEEIKKNNFYIYQLSLGFSYWLSFNQNTLDLKERVAIKHKLDLQFKSSSFFTENNLTRSRQLFLPYGPGRLTIEEINKIENNLKCSDAIKIKKMKILLPKNLQKQLLEGFKNAFGLSEFYFYNDFSQYAELIKNQKFDILLVNNDLSSIDLRSSIDVTFNPNRPLVFTDKNKKEYSEIISNIKNEISASLRYQKIKHLGEKLLEDVLVYPLYYDYGYVLVKDGINLSELNKSGAETVSWKIK